ncbi:MAG TPA: ABC transporter substrate-binding protein [Paracoccaceae bacterium]|nr:ABC transporter substrate-binding protein [Paracoccaceae bacterium]
MRGTVLAVASALAVAITGPAMAKPIKIGVLLPYSGVYAALAEDIDNGFDLAIEHYGEGLEFEIIREDTETAPPVGLAKAKKLAFEDEVDVLTGVVSSGVLGAIRDFVHETKIPLVISNAGLDIATGERCTPYFTRVSFTNASPATSLGEWLAEQGVETAYTIAPDYAGGKDSVHAFTEAFEEGGGKVLGGEFTPFQKTQDFGPYLTKAKASGAEALYVFYSGSEAVSFLKQYDSFGLKENLPLYGAFLTSPLYVNAAGKAAEGVVSSLNYVPTIENDQNEAFVAAFTEKYGHGPAEYSAAGYDAARAIIQAVKSGATDRASIAEALPKADLSDSPRGPSSIDPETHNIVQTMYIYETVSGDGDELTQKIIGTVPDFKPPLNGCEMPEF